MNWFRNFIRSSLASSLAQLFQNYKLDDDQQVLLSIRPPQKTTLIAIFIDPGLHLLKICAIVLLVVKTSTGYLLKKKRLVNTFHR